MKYIYISLFIVLFSIIFYYMFFINMDANETKSKLSIDVPQNNLPVLIIEDILNKPINNTQIKQFSQFNPIISQDTYPEINQITPNVYLTNESNAHKYDLLKNLGINQIICVGVELDKHNTNDFSIMYIPIMDSNSTDIYKYFQQAIEFINYPGAVTLVHCKMGISRSTTIVASYLLYTYGLSTIKALDYIQTRRPIINPNKGFVFQLGNFESILGITNNK